ncbi:MAG TPA: ABC transporter permease, partial [Vicinamibacterales bacterium]|nr:ABC transporter permease [Vicinamibacterales bacterium]
MRHLRRVVTRVLAMLGWSRRGDDFADELESHLQLHIDDNIRAGMPPDEARRVALARIGSVAALSARQRDQRMLPGVESLFQDLRHGARLLRVSPVFSAVAILSLALGIGANTAIFSIINGAMLRALPVADPSRLVQLSTDGESTDFSNGVWEQIRARPPLLHQAFAWSESSFDLADRGEARIVDGLYVSGSFFEALGITPVAGRLLTVADDVRDAAGPSGAVAVVSHRFWQRHLGGAPDAIGRSIRLNRVPFTIVGVMPAEFFGPAVGGHADVVVPIGSVSRLRSDSLPLDETSWRWLSIMGRLAPGQSPAQAQAALDASARSIREATTSSVWRPEDRERYLREGFRVVAAPGGPGDFRARYGRPLAVLMGVVILVLLIACANMANLLLARSAARQREMSLRLALGASRLRLARQLLTESLIFAALGAAGALVVARWGSGFLIHQISTGQTPVYLDLTLDWRVLGFTAAVAIGVSLLFGVAPALRASRVAPAGAAGARLVPSEARARWGSALIVVQVALSLVLVVGAGLFVQTLGRLNARDPGFDRRAVLVVSLDGRRTAVPAESRLAMYERVRAAVAALPGVSAAALSRITPVSNNTWGTSIENPPGLTLPESDRNVLLNFVTP